MRGGRSWSGYGRAALEAQNPLTRVSHAVDAAASAGLPSNSSVFNVYPFAVTNYGAIGDGTTGACRKQLLAL